MITYQCWASEDQNDSSQGRKVEASNPESAALRYGEGRYGKSGCPEMQLIEVIHRDGTTERFTVVALLSFAIRRDR